MDEPLKEGPTMPMMTVSPADVEGATLRTLSADHVFFDADGREHILDAGSPLLELQVKYAKVHGRLCVVTDALAVVDGGVRILWTVGKLVAWERV
jgi:hypothetical protein